MEGDDFRRSGPNCLRFYYSMNGFHCGQLTVYTRVNNGNRVTRWKMAGDQGRGWQSAAVDVNMNGVTEVENILKETVRPPTCAIFVS